MSRITKLQKQIAYNHIHANREQSFSNPKVTSMEELVAELINGETYEHLYKEIVYRYASMTSLILSNVLDHESKAYTQSVYKGFKEVLNSINLK
jgi:ribosomal protein L11 methylase PrmA